MDEKQNHNGSASRRPSTAKIVAITFALAICLATLVNLLLDHPLGPTWEYVLMAGAGAALLAIYWLDHHWKGVFALLAIGFVVYFASQAVWSLRKW
jgi:hypothetical protein